MMWTSGSGQVGSTIPATLAELRMRIGTSWVIVAECPVELDDVVIVRQRTGVRSDVRFVRRREAEVVFEGLQLRSAR